MNRADGNVRREFFFGMEGAVLLCGLLPFASQAPGRERLMLLFFIPFMLATGFIMEQTERRYGVKSALLTGVLAVSAGAGVMLGMFGGTGFLYWEAALAYVFAARMGMWLDGSLTAGEQFRKFFLWESFAVPVLLLMALWQGWDRPVALVSAALYLLLRSFSLIYAQRMEGEAGGFRLRSLLITAGTALLLLMLLMVFPAAMVVFATVGTSLFMLVDWMGLQVVLPARMKQALAEIQLGGGNDAAAGQLVDSGSTNHIPLAVWVGFGMVTGAMLLAAIYRYRAKPVHRKNGGNPGIRLVRVKEAPPRRLGYLPGATGVRQVYQTLLRGMEDKGWPVRPGETPRDYIHRLEKSHPGVMKEQQELSELVRQYGEARYGADPLRGNGAADAGDPPPERASRLVDRVLAAVKPGKSVDDSTP